MSDRQKQAREAAEAFRQALIEDKTAGVVDPQKVVDAFWEMLSAHKRTIVEGRNPSAFLRRLVGELSKRLQTTSMEWLSDAREDIAEANRQDSLRRH